MDNKEPKIEYEVISHRETDNDRRLVMICEKSEPDDILAVDNSQDVAYEIHDGEDIYHLVEQTTAPTKRPLPPLITTSNSSDSNNCQYFVINETVAKRPCLILPKPDNFPINDTLQKIQPKKRDDKRRATHNEVERRRRDKINQWIFKLKELLPEGALVNEKTVPTAVSVAAGKSSQNDSKSAILIKACDYVKDMQEELDNFKKCLSNSESLHRENLMLKSENELLKNEIEQLKNGISAQKQQICRPAADSKNYDTT